MIRTPSNIPLPLAGFLALAVAMGIGRFAFTPILPMMQADQGLSLAQGGWLASANYLGYLIGALWVTHLNWTAPTLLRRGLWLVILTTVAMGLGDLWWGWLTWRLIAGIASAFVMIGTSALCIARLTALGQTERSGIVFAGVGCGVAFAGLACMGLAIAGTTSSQAWLWLGLAALLGMAGASTLWRHPLPAPTLETVSADTAHAAVPSLDDIDVHRQLPLHWGLIWCYGFLGFGYILPATFLPAQARLLVPDPLLFSLAWPIFGATSALSTLVASRLARRFTRPQIWAGAQAVMALGVFLPVAWHSLAAILIAACCVGSTFMVITMVGMQEAQHRVGAAGAKRQMAAMTASFAVAQLIGPLFFSLTHTWFGAPLGFALVLGTLGLLAGVLPILHLGRPVPRDADQSAR